MSTENNSKWYIIQVVSNYEIKVKEFLENKEFNDSDSQIEVYLPIKTHITKTGKQRRKSLFPGYIFIKTVMNDDVWYIIRNTQYVTGIVGSSGHGAKPTPIGEEQIQNIINQIAQSEISGSVNTEAEIKEKIDINFEINNIVNVISGNFQGSKGKVIEINPEKHTVSVEIEFFGRLTLVTLPVTEVIKK